MQRVRWQAGLSFVLASLVGSLFFAHEHTTSAAGSLGVVSGKTDRPNVLVYLDDVPGAAPDVPAAHRTITQRDLAFAPEVSVIVKGTTIDFPNDDRVFHNVFSLSQPARFDLGLYKSGEGKSVQFTRPGVVDIYCNIHPQMAAKVRVLDTRYFAISGADGTFLIPNVPAGTYPVVAWQPYGEPARATVTVEAGRASSMALALPPAKGRVSHERKDGTPYGRYQ